MWQFETIRVIKGHKQAYVKLNIHIRISLRLLDIIYMTFNDPIVTSCHILQLYRIKANCIFYPLFTKKFKGLAQRLLIQISAPPRLLGPLRG